ncbi:MAG: hypothetical protein OXJ55_15400 [Caldilineaceae bacterium]|nr:hypothetical protein [Caldilineaceae bacterium]MDE0462395.1 hypothetical protein [Caldilineaceae bacterium]
MPLTEKQEREIAGALRDIDPAQVLVNQQLTTGQQAQKGLSMIRIAEEVASYRMRARRPELSREESMGMARQANANEKEVTVVNPSLEFSNFMRDVLDALEESGITYLVGGAVAVWGWGEVRTTQDFDVVVDLPVEQMAKLSEALRERGMLVPTEVMLDLYISPADLPINAIHLPTGYKLEIFLLRPNDGLRASALQRRLLVDFGPAIGEAYVHSPEDLILYKLQYYSLSSQPKHIRDIGSIIATVGDDSLEQDYLIHWIDRLDLTEFWMEIRKQLEGPDG